MKLKLSWLAFAAGAVLSLPLTGGSLQAQQTPKPEKVVETHSAKGRGAATGADENIKTPRAANKVGATVAAPSAKGGAQTRGAGCVVHVDNRTSYYIDVYLDGDYRGTMGPWDDLYRSVGCGSTRLYARANFDNGTYTSWGPTYAEVDGTHTWRLWP